MNFDLAQHRYLNTRVLVQRFSILELVEITITTFDSHALQELCAFLSRATCSNAIAQANIWPCHFIKNVDTTRAHAYLDTPISIRRMAHLAVRRTSFLSAGFLPVGIKVHALNNTKIWYVQCHNIQTDKPKELRQKDYECSH